MGCRAVERLDFDFSKAVPGSQRDSFVGITHMVHGLLNWDLCWDAPKGRALRTPSGTQSGN